MKKSFIVFSILTVVLFVFGRLYSPPVCANESQRITGQCYPEQTPTPTEEVTPTASAEATLTPTDTSSPTSIPATGVPPTGIPATGVPVTIINPTGAPQPTLIPLTNGSGK